MHAAHERGHQGARVGPRREQAFAERRGDGCHALGDERFDELLLAAEVVVHECRRHSGLQRDRAQARRRDPVARKANDGRIEQAFALIGFVGARATVRFPG